YLILIPKGWTGMHRDGGASAWQWFKANYPAIAAHLEPWAEKARKRYDKGGYWWELRTCDYYDKFEKPKIMFAEIALTGQFTMDLDSVYCDTTGYILGSDSFYLLGLLNSKLCNFFFSNISSSIRGGFFRWKRQYVEALPVCHANAAGSEQIAALAKKIMEMNRRLADTKVPVEKERLRRQIEAVDRQIDQCVYALYGLTPGEIEIVEKTVNRPCN
ncbi:MAG TPA: TaqI-like C-terminal specificity domain-containing protein, partial [Desulfosalsimonadaceae bacterium]|nr:TaqI-like C-terminal specificity domain-containing protein [Desulfosalsimonadaceae bacterium]